MAASQKVIVISGVMLMLASMCFADMASSCDGSKNEGSMIAAASDKKWDGGAVCGKTVTVKCVGATNALQHPCTGESVVLKIVDYCPDCNGTLDLSEEAFSEIANTDAGKVRIEFDVGS